MTWQADAMRSRWSEDDRDPFMRPAWQKKAACLGKGPDPFFNADWRRGGFVTPEMREVLEMCAGCEVRRECKEMGEGELYGTWGGEGRMVRQTQRIRKRQGDDDGEA